jgi:hypothetical protein
MRDKRTTPYLDEANVLGVDAEALSAGVDAVLPDHSVPVAAHPAVETLEHASVGQK